MSHFIKRFLSAIIAIIIIIIIQIYLPTNGLIYLCWFLSGVAAYEYSNLSFSQFQSDTTLKFFFYLSCLINYYLSVFHPTWSASFLTINILLSIILCLLISSFRHDLEQIKDWSLKSSFGLIYCGILPSYAGKLLALDQGLMLFIFVFIAVFSGDTMAYIIGVNFGKKKLSPHISPNKTIEGSLGGLIGSLVFTTAYGVHFYPHVEMWKISLAGLCLGLFGQTGDLFESLLKRINNVKDSGQFMPGHGGLLDRVDSLIFALPIMYFFSFIF